MKKKKSTTRVPDNVNPLTSFVKATTVALRFLEKELGIKQVNVVFNPPEVELTYE